MRATPCSMCFFFYPTRDRFLSLSPRMKTRAINMPNFHLLFYVRVSITTRTSDTGVSTWIGTPNSCRVTKPASGIPYVKSQYIVKYRQHDLWSKYRCPGPCSFVTPSLPPVFFLPSFPCVARKVLAGRVRGPHFPERFAPVETYCESFSRRSFRLTHTILKMQSRAYRKVLFSRRVSTRPSPRHRFEVVVERTGSTLVSSSR